MIGCFTVQGSPRNTWLPPITCSSTDHQPTGPIRYKKRNAAVAAAAATQFNPTTENPSKLDEKKLGILPQQKSYYRQTDSIRGVDSQPEVMWNWTCSHPHLSMCYWMPQVTAHLPVKNTSPTTLPFPQSKKFSHWDMIKMQLLTSPSCISESEWMKKP